MSLIDAMMEDCVIMNRSKLPDGEGGYITSWSEGAPIKCAIVFDNSLRSKIAQSEGFTNAYTITTEKSLVLEFNDVIKRLKDGKSSGSHLIRAIMYRPALQHLT